MQNVEIGKIDKLIIHFVGNKNNGDGVKFSNSLTDFNKIENYIMTLIHNSFKSDEFYQFYFIPTIELNPMYQFISSIFNNQDSFIEQSQNTARYLYDKSSHPQIKGGELGVAYIKDCRFEDEQVDCIAIFKAERKETVLEVSSAKSGLGLKNVNGLSTRKLDKGCIIFNTGKETGFILSVIDNTNRNGEAQYWKDEFLAIQPIKNEYHQTNEFLGITKEFITNELSDFEISKSDQIDLLNRSVDYFKSHSNFDKKEFENEVFSDKNIIESFRKFDQQFREENKVELLDQFEISTSAVKKQSRIFKKVLKLDKNFHIYIHGDSELIKQGVEDDGRKFYKIYYQDEA